MTETRVRINENGRLVIPASLRQALGIHPGDELVLRLEDNELRISTMRHNIERARHLLRRKLQPGTSLVKELITERGKAAKRE